MKIQNNCLPYCLVAALLATSIPGFTQTQGRNIIQSAMEDEMKRSLDELHIDSLERPFFISYTVRDFKNSYISARLGALISSQEATSRTKNVRVLVGNYEFNDESLDDNLFSGPAANDVELPIDDDYIGIRRALWASTDNVYRSAARQLDKNTAMLKDQKKLLADVPHRTFAKMAPVKITTTWTPTFFDRTKWEEILRKLSKVFVKSGFPGSVVVLNVSQGFEYLVNSEGTSIKVPIHFAAIQVNSQSKNDEGDFIIDTEVWRGNSVEDLPSFEQLQSQLNEFIQRMDELKKAKAFSEEYTGPILIEGSAVAGLFSTILFDGKDRLFYDNQIPSLSGMRFDRSNSMESKIGKSVVAANLSVKLLPGLKKYKGVELMGAYEADDEGVVPSPELKLIENGILKDLCNDRTLTSSGQTANGHRNGPGVVMATMEGTVSYKELKARLFEQAKVENLDYAYILKTSAFGQFMMFNVYKVTIADGKEELVRSARFSSLSIKALKKITGSNEESVYQTTSSGLTTFIVPKAVLISGMDIQRATMPSMKDEDYVPSPLTDSK